jgi:hypothetical protein
MQNILWQRIGAMLLGVAFISSSAVARAQTLTAGTAQCRFAVPADLGEGSPLWMGNCASGHAEGPGVIRIQTKTTPHLFYGSLKAGVPQTGVLQLAEDQWQPVWKFDAQMHVVNDDAGNMQTALDAFRAAAKGASAAAAHYQQAGNKASAAYYSRQATRLAKQMDE